MTDSAGNRPTWEHDFGNGVVGYADNGTGNYITYINDQDAPGISEKQFGITNVGHGGCGAVAAYNALVKLGKPESFDSVLDYFNGWNSVSRTNIFGLAGMMPKHISAYFKEKGYTVRFYTDEESIDSASRSADACIGWYMYTSKSFPFIGGHFVEYHYSGNAFTAYNTSRGVTEFDSPVKYFTSGSRFIFVCITIDREG